MASIDKTLELMRREPTSVSFNELKKVCQAYDKLNSRS